MKQVKGFTLIEVMIVVALLAILAVIALPAYQKQVRDSRRADATAVLMQARQTMQRHYTKYYSYQNASQANVPSKSPIDGSASYYQIALTSLSASNFTLTATPQGARTHDSCGELTINQAGQKTANGSSSNIEVDRCW